MRAPVTLHLSLLLDITLQASFKALTEAVHLEAVLEEPLVASGALDGQMLVAVVSHGLPLYTYGFPPLSEAPPDSELQRA